MKRKLIGVGIVVQAILTAAGAGAEPMLPGYLTDAGAGPERREGAYETPAHLRYPYAATYYVEPTVKAGTPVRIGFYVTDWAHAKERAKDDSARFDVTVRYAQTGATGGVGCSQPTVWQTKTAKNVKSGDGTLDLGVLPEGEWSLSLQAKDLGSGLPSGIVWHDFRVVGADFFRIAADKVHRMTEADLAAYGITRRDADYERLVSVPVDAKFAFRRDNWKNRAKDGLKIVDEFLAAHPHVDAKTPGYAVYVPSLKGVPVNRSFEMLRVVRDRGYDTNAVAQAAATTRKGLQRLLDEKRAAGVRKVILPKGVYRVDASPVKIPAGLILDLGGATVKMNGFIGSGGKSFRIASGRDTVLENGIVEGDYFEHDYEHSPNKSEWVCGWEIDSAAWYCEVRDVVTRNVTGYGGCNGSGKDAPGDWLTYSTNKNWNLIALHGKKSEWTAGGYRLDGTYDGNDAARWTSRPVDVACFVPFRYLTVSKALGYQGIRTRNWNVTVAYFDAAQKFLGAELVSQYRVSRLPEGAKTVRVSIEVKSLEEARNSELSVFLLKIPQNCAIRRCRFERCRAVGYAMSACRNWLMEDCDFSYSGEALATCAFDAEDGWDGMQDVTFRRNRFHDNPNNDFLTCAGHNFVYENNTGAIHLWSRTFSPCIRGNDFTSASFTCANRNRTGYGRYGGNTYRTGLRIGDDYGLGQDWNIVFDGYDFRSKSTNELFKVQSGGTGLFRNCTFDGVAASPGAAEKCTFRNCNWGWARYNCGTIRDCTFENCRIPRVNATNLYERCTFRNVTLSPVMWGGQYFRDCTMENLQMPRNMPPNVFTGLVTRCTLKGKCIFPREMVLADDVRCAQFTIDANLPAGCLKSAVVAGDRIHLTHDYRDTDGQWIYWAFRVRGAAGRTLTFDFPKVKYSVGSRGAAVSTDRGRSWRWSSAKHHLPTDAFTWTFAADADEVWFSQTIPYLPKDWDAFLASHAKKRGTVFETGELCRTKKGRSVPYARFGRLDGRARERFFLASRHHCQESAATYVVEGMAACFLADDDLGKWLRENVELRVVPFADYDGVVDGDQGKNRKPHDHCRDYNEGRPQVYPEVAAIMKMLKAWKPTIVQDTHCPWLRSGGGPNDTNEITYQCGNSANRDAMSEFGKILERVQRSGFGYRAADDVPYGKSWNKGTNYTQGQTLNIWAQLDLKTCRFVTTFEIPFANQREKTLYPADLRGFGRDIMLAYRVYLAPPSDLR